MKNIVVILADGFEEVEALVPIDVLRRANFNVVVAGLNKINITSAHKVNIVCDDIFSNKYLDFDCVILPGGMPGTLNLKNSKEVNDLITYFNDKNKLICAICAAPSILESLNLLKNKKATSYPSFLNDSATKIRDERVVVDLNIVTSKGAGTAFDFAYMIASLLGANDNELKKIMMYE